MVKRNDSVECIIKLAYAKRCRGWWAPPYKLKLFEDVTRVSVGGYEEFTYRTVQKFSRLSDEQRAHPFYLIPRLVSAPYASDIEMRSGDQRHYLWAYASTAHGPDKARSLREALSRQCASSDVCVTGKSADGKTSTGKAPCPSRHRADAATYGDGAPEI